MSIAKRAAIAFALVFCVAVSVSGVVFSIARSSSTALLAYRNQSAALDTVMWSLRSDFYNYDDQMNMYVAVLAGGGPKDDLAEVTYQQGVAARGSLGKDLGGPKRWPVIPRSQRYWPGCARTSSTTTSSPSRPGRRARPTTSTARSS